MFNEKIVEEMLKADELLAFRLKLYKELEGMPHRKALKMVYSNVILSDIYRTNKYSSLKARCEDEKSVSI